MQSRLVDVLCLKHPPVALLFADSEPSEGIQFKPGRMGCVAAMMLSASRGKTTYFDQHTFGCPGGGSGLGFGNCYDGFPIEQLLSTGGKAELADGRIYDMHEGERFHRSPEVTTRWLQAFPFRNVPAEYVVLKPLAEVSGDEAIELVWWLVNADQLSALVTLAGFDTGALEPASAAWGAACQSIAFALAEADRDQPRGVIGFFDISQRHRVDREILSFTVPYRLFVAMEANVEQSFLATHAWQELRKRQR
jgi:uncharacterized protein (DUF169 family)